jgi:hypothetical protein
VRNLGLDGYRRGEARFNKKGVEGGIGWII